MIKLPLFGFFTGLHLALLQFSYFFLLLINITSTYVAYATIVFSWMSGTVLGLLWERLDERLILLGGVLSYYAIYALVMNDPLSPYTFPFAAAGVAITGLWAGRFFITMQPLFARADQLFFHENNGFLLGVLAVFVGFTMLGNDFLLWTPLLSGIFLFGYLWWLKVVPPALSSSIATEQTAASSVGLIESAQNLTVSITTAMGVIIAILGLGVLFQALIADGDSWMYLKGKYNIIIWFSTLQLLLLGIVAYGNFEIVMLLRRLKRSTEGRWNHWIWLIFAVGFLFLALNKRFGILLPLQEILFETNGGLFLYTLISLTLLSLLFKDLLHQPKSLVLYCIALILVIATTILSSVTQTTESLLMAHSRTFVFQEIGELWIQLLFLISFFIMLRWRMGQIRDILSV